MEPLLEFASGSDRKFSLHAQTQAQRLVENEILKQMVWKKVLHYIKNLHISREQILRQFFKA